MPDQEYINELFNQNSVAFRDATEKHYALGTYKRGEIFLSVLKKHVPDQDSTVLDYGCGTGRISMMIGQEGYRVLGIDPASEHVHIAQSMNNLSNVKFELLDKVSHEYNGEFDAVVSSSVFEFVPDAQQYLTDIYRVLKPGGVLLMSVPNLYSCWRWYAKIRFGKKYKHFSFQKNLLTEQQVVEMLNKQQFQKKGTSLYYESAFDHKGLGFLNRFRLFGTLTLMVFYKQ